jgi:Protein of unknown function (DUF815)
MRPCRYQTASVCGSASTIVARTTISTWCGAMPRICHLPIADEALTREALAWAIGRGARSGRVAFQYTQDLAGRLGVRLDGGSEG